MLLNSTVRVSRSFIRIAVYPPDWGENKCDDFRENLLEDDVDVHLKSSATQKKHSVEQFSQKIVISADTEKNKKL